MSDKEKSEVKSEIEFEVKTSPVRSQKYKDSQSSAEDNKSSGWVLLCVGIVGIIAVILGMVGVIPLRFANPYMFYGVFCAVCILFLVMGVISFANAKKFELRAKGEKTLEDELIKWADKNLTPDVIDAEIDNAESESEEILYFKRFKVITDKLNNQFLNLDPMFVEHLIDDTLYDKLFPESLEVTYDEYEDEEDEEYEEYFEETDGDEELDEEASEEESEETSENKTSDDDETDKEK